jgi:diguanylate cyclase (GGDEF)-like protein
MRQSLASSLSWQLLRTVLSIYFLLTLLVTVIHVVIEFNHTRDMVRDELASIERTFYPALATALWELNNEQLLALQHGIVDLPIINLVRVVEVNGRETATESDRQARGGKIEHRFTVSYEFGGETIPLARVFFETSDGVVFERLRVGFQMILMNALIKSLALTLLFIWAFKRHLGRPLQNLIAALAAVDLESLQRQRIDCRQHQDNELTTLEQTFNAMLDRLEVERSAHDAELEAINRGLEAEVLARTRELEEANQRLAQLAQSDPLTGLANRRYFAQRADQEIARARRNQTQVAMLMIDIDHFKSINDTWGHAMGDEVLRNFAVTANCLRSSDLLARLGGEEFAILLPDTLLEAASEVGERILNAVRQQRVVTDSSKEITYRVSIGLTQLQPGDISYETLLGRADRALYQAKAAGRDRMVVAA